MSLYVGILECELNYYRLMHLFLRRNIHRLSESVISLEKQKKEHTWSDVLENLLTKLLTDLATEQSSYEEYCEQVNEWEVLLEEKKIEMSLLLPSIEDE